MFRVHIVAIFFIGIYILTNWQKGSLEFTVFWGIISRSLADGCQPLEETVSFVRVQNAYIRTKFRLFVY